MASGSIKRVAFDIGGTFTDVILQYADGRLQLAKVLSLLDTVGRDIRTTMDFDPADVGAFIHGTTVAANALLEGRIARAGLITTAGFRDVLEMRSQRRPNIYDVNWDRSKPLIPRDLRMEVKERILADGRVEMPLDPADLDRAVDALLQAGVEAIAVCLVNAYANGSHEGVVRQRIRARAPDLPISVSSEQFAEIREYERTSTTAVNASLMPVIDRYLTALQGQLEIGDAELLIMQSNGGLMDAGVARRRPVTIVESGPAAGVLAAAKLAREVGLKRVLSLDMGGTTAKASLIEDGVPVERPGCEVGGGANLASRFFGGSGYAVRVPSLDIAEVGAGGGSIGWIDRGGALRVGPHGAGAQPGPACYGRGGRDPTVTDANVVLGTMNPTALAGASLRIDRDAAVEAIMRVIARPLGLELMAAAHGMVQVACSTTMRALRAVSIERGVDPRNFAMMAFGGAGPIFAAELAATLGIGEVHIPPFPGIFSAVGLLMADYRQDFVRSLLVPVEQMRVDEIRANFRDLEEAARSAMALQNVAAERVSLVAEVDIQYRRQDMPLTIAMPAASADVAVTLAQAFHLAHRTAFGYERDHPIDIVSLRIRATARTETLPITELNRLAPMDKLAHAGPTRRRVYFGSRSGYADVPVVSRAALAGVELAGPLIVEEWDTSTVVPPGWRARVDASGNIVIRNREGPAP